MSARGPRVTAGVVCALGIGPSRGGRTRNEDNYLLCRERRVAWREGPQEVSHRVPYGVGVLAAVADGMGGHEDGEVASAAAVQAMSRLYGRPEPTDPEDALHRFVLDAHRRIRARVAVAGPVKIGTTLVVAWLLGRRAYWAHVGDSRIYHVRGAALTRLTRDHTRGEFARRDVRERPKHAEYLSQSFIYGSRGLGDDGNIRIDRGIDTGFVDILDGDRLLLCSDGVTGKLPDALVADVLRHVADPSACAVALAERAVAHGSDDNITAVLLRVDALDDVVAPEVESTLVPEPAEP